MDIPLYFGRVNVYLYGEKALMFLEGNTVIPTFQVNGFSDPSIFIEDNRQGIPQAVEAYFSTRSPEEFYPLFNRPATAIINQCENGNIIIQLTDAEDEEITDYLWIAVGITDEIPAYDYLLWKIVSQDSGKYAIFAIFTMEVSLENCMEVDCLQSGDHANR
jgi:hypothetical protein